MFILFDFFLKLQENYKALPIPFTSKEFNQTNYVLKRYIFEYKFFKIKRCGAKLDINSPFCLTNGFIF